jgi:FkbM family methyltransferase
MKRIVKKLIRRVGYHTPGAIRSSLMEGFLDGMRLGNVYSSVLPRCGVVEVAANGDRGVVASSAADTLVIVGYAQTGTCEPGVTEELKSFFAIAGGSYFDIGANIGLTTIPFASDPRIRCIAFEPEPINFGLLQRNVARNAPGSSVALHQVALFHKRTTLSLALAEGNIGDHRLTIAGVPGRRTVKVPAVPLDDFIDDATPPLAVKIDTQGAEPYVIAGGPKVLSQAGLLVMEFCPHLMRQLGGDPEIPISLVSNFQSVAVMRRGKAETPCYISAADGVQAMRDMLRTARETDEDYLDIIARR